MPPEQADKSVQVCIKPGGPSLPEILLHLPQLMTDHLGFMTRMTRTHGRVFRLPFRYPTFFLSDPEDIRHILVTNHRNYRKARGLRISRSFLGTGLITADEPKHSVIRKLMQPAFSKERVDAAGGMMCEAVKERLQKHWRNGGTVDLSRELSHISLAIATRSFFGKDLSAQTDRIQDALTVCQRHIERRVRFGSLLPEHWPIPSHVRYRKAIGVFDEIIGDLITSRRNAPGLHNDLLSLLMSGKGESGSPLSDKEIRDELVTILLAGHETTSNALTWVFYLLSTHPEEENRFHAEVDRLLPSCVFDSSIGEQLPLTAAIVAEAMRLYPPVWRIGRRAISADILPSGTHLPEGAEIVILTFAVHRDAEFFPEPDRFLPDRFLSMDTRPRFSFFPFGGGPRICIGEEFAVMEAVIALALIGSKFRLVLTNRSPVTAEALITLRPKHPLRMQLLTRTRPVTSRAPEGVLQP